MTTTFRKSLAGRRVGSRAGFRWRGGEITRLEGFSDAVFAFAITLLVVSLEVPRTFRELSETMRGFLPFAVCFTLLVVVWREHYVFFRRYGLQDNTTIWLNAALLFVVLFYVYPLKFLFTLVLAPFTGASPAGAEPMIETARLPSLFLIYGAGIVAIYVLLAMLYVHAYRRRRELELDAVESYDTRASIVGHLLAAGIGVVSCLVAVTVPPGAVGLAGFVYFLFGPVLAIHGTLAGRRRRRLAGARPA